jgi:hypothetical protein
MMEKIRHSEIGKVQASGRIITLRPMCILLLLFKMAITGSVFPN